MHKQITLVANDNSPDYMHNNWATPLNHKDLLTHVPYEYTTCSLRWVSVLAADL